jgi:hypothetical protein
MFSLWHVLTLISAVMPLSGAFVAAKVSRCGTGGYVLATAIGLLLGFGNVLGMVRVQKVLRGMRESAQRFLPAIYGAALVWAFVSDFLSLSLTRVLLGHL